MADFVIQTVLRAREEISTKAVKAFGRVQAAGDKVAKRIGLALSKQISGDALARNLKGVGVVAASVVGGIGFGLQKAAAGFKEISEEMAETATFAQSLDLDAALLGALQAKGTEKGIQDVKEVQNAIQELLLRTSELRSGEGSLKGFFEGIKADKLSAQFKATKSSTEALKLAFSALATETDASNRVALGDALFGGSDDALKLRRLFQTTDEVKSFLGAVDDISGASSEQFNQVGKLGDARAKLDARIGSLQRNLTARLAPSVTRVVSSMESWLSANEKIVDQQLGDLVEFLSEKIDEITEIDIGKWFTELAEGAGDAARSLLAFGRGALEAGQTIVSWGHRVIGVGRSLGVTAQNVGTLAAGFFAAWSVGKVVALGNAMLGLGRTALTVVKNLNNVARAAGPAGRALSAALTFTGAIGAVVTLAGVLSQVITQLTGIEDFAERNVKHDIGSQAEGLNAEIEALRRERHQTFGEMARFGSTRIDGTERRDDVARLDAEIAALRARRDTIEGVARIERGDVAGDELAREQLGRLLAGEADFGSADQLTKLVAEQGGTAELLQQFLADEKTRRVRAADAEKAAAAADEAIRSGRSRAPRSSGAATGGDVSQQILRTLGNLNRQLELIGAGINVDLQAMQVLARDQKTRARLGRG